MVAQNGALSYKPTNPNGNWTILCEIPQAAKAIDVGASAKDLAGTVIPNNAYISKVWAGTEPVPGLESVYSNKPTTYDMAKFTTPASYMAGTSYFTKSSDWYKNGLPLVSGKSTGGMAPATYTGNGNDYLDNYFKTGLQATATATSAAGSSSGKANAQILKKTSAYWVAMTSLMYNLDMAAVNLALTNGTADAKANFDGVAAAFYGCGETNPVPLPLGPSGEKIVYPAEGVAGTGPLTMSIYGLANKRAENYNQFVLRSTESSSTCTVAGLKCKNVASLNIVIADALNAGPTAASINAIRDGVLTIFTQATQRYAAKVTLAAQLPGNGMGGSTNPDTAIKTPAANPTTGSYIPSAVLGNGKQPTACGGATSYIAPLSTPIAGNAANKGMTEACPSATTLAGGTPAAGTCVNGQVTGINACSGGSPGASVPVSGSTASNTATYGSVMPAVTQATPTCAAALCTAGEIATFQGGLSGPFQLGCTGAGVISAAGVAPTTAQYTASVAAGAGTCALSTLSCAMATNSPAGANANGFVGMGCEGITNQQLQRAVRGLPSNPVTGAGAAVSITSTPIACIDKTVCFNDVRADLAGTTGAERCVRLCDPAGAPPVPIATVTAFADRKAAYAAQVVTVAGSNMPATAAGSIGASYWDPITAAQASMGARCCDAAIYSDDGVGIPASYGTQATINAATTTTGTIDLSTTGFVANTAMTPVQPTGGPMATEVSPGSMCPVDPDKTGTEGLSEFTNPQEVYQLEGQAFYACMAGIQRAIPTPTNQAKITQDVNVAKQKTCSETLTKMFKMNLGVVASTATTGKAADGSTCQLFDALFQYQTSAAQFCRGTAKSAIQFPLWNVGIGDGTATTMTKYNVPNGYCYSNACFTDLMSVATETSYQGTTRLGELVSGPNMGSKPSSATAACGRANEACTAAPTGWTGGQVQFEKCSKTTVSATGVSGCADAAEIKKQYGTIPTV